jgi:predicted transcriptional regulator
MEITQYIASKAATAMREQNISKSELARLAKVPNSTITKLLAGGLGRITTIDKIFKTLKLKITIEENSN